MTPDTRDDVIERALALPQVARADLARRLIESLDSDALEDPAAVERAWGEEIARRVRRVLETGDTGTPLERVIAEAREALARRRAARRSS